MRPTYITSAPYRPMAVPGVEDCPKRAAFLEELRRRRNNDLSPVVNNTLDSPEPSATAAPAFLSGDCRTYKPVERQYGLAPKVAEPEAKVTERRSGICRVCCKRIPADVIADNWQATTCSYDCREALLRAKRNMAHRRHRAKKIAAREAAKAAAQC